VRGASEHAALREKGIIIIIFSARAKWPQAAKGMDVVVGITTTIRGCHRGI
jgi:hypothetical protein